LYQRAESPQAERWLAVFLDDIEVGVVRTTTHLADLLDDRVDALGEGIAEHPQGSLCQLECQCDVERDRKYGQADLSATERVVARKVEHICDELRDRVASDPEEHRLAIFDQVQAMTFESFGSQRERGREDNAMLADFSSLETLSALV
jgi:hypothetical protein